ncbi:alpha/beta hydrolase [Leptomonas seymouri]|uniref:Alpha/beta hydrolase n=1 Tax=Leptomonas seymouri TaxID=5684 RepID=A0A0N1I0S3_LEPSE|nr:alpha/beta hydrolase [Leptomonas seymouri]|eukprot:KPI82685.1 alpha/beta hydrolase [Leptomonas seymouri]
MASSTDVEHAWSHTSQFTLSSSRRNVPYLIQTFVPCQTPPKDGFPVLYCLDGNTIFHSACNVAAVIANPRKLHPDMRPVLIVAIGYPDHSTFHERQRARDFTPPPTEAQQAAFPFELGQAEDFFDFIDCDLKPQVRHRFPVDEQQHSLFGHSFGGLFVMHTYLQHPRSFCKFVAASPSVWYNDFDLVAAQRAWAKTVTDEELKTKVAPLIVTFGSLENSGPSKRPPVETQRLREEFVGALVKLGVSHPVWVYNHPAEHHITNLFASLPKAVVFVSCQSMDACHKLLDDKAVL